MARVNWTDLSDHELEREYGEMDKERQRRGLKAEVDEFKRTAIAAADKTHQFLKASLEDQKALRAELGELLYKVTYRVRKFQAFAGIQKPQARKAKSRTTRKGA